MPISTDVEWSEIDGLMPYLTDNAKETEWKIEDILKENQKVGVVLAFDYKDKLEGTVDVSMVWKDGWKIDSIDIPTFDRVDF